jgi:long-chain acyl-CoA synthetase
MSPAYTSGSAASEKDSEPDFRSLPDQIRLHAAAQPAAPALSDSTTRIDYAALDRMMDRVARALQRDGLQPGESIAICAQSSAAYMTVFLGALRAGAVVAPLSPSVTPASFRIMLADAEARWLFCDASAGPLLGDKLAARCIALGEHVEPTRDAIQVAPGIEPLTAWLDAGGVEGEAPRAVAIKPEWAFNIIYSSGTTGTPKGIVQPHYMRWVQANRLDSGYGRDTVSLMATPLYSNTTLVVLIPTLAHGGSVILMEKFDARRYLTLAEQHRATHTMLVPVQYQRLMALPDFESCDLSAFRMKFCTSAPFSATLKADVLRRWPGGLVEFYGMTEGGGTCILQAHEHPDKLHTVGQPAAGHDIRLINEEGREVPVGQPGEVVGSSPSMMVGYHRQPEKTREAEWYDTEGKRFIRTGDVGRFDADGFLILLDRRKDVIISGGFNIYPSDLESVLREHPQVSDAAVVGAPSELWGETPVGFVVLADLAGAPAIAEADVAASILHWVNQRLGKMQRLAQLHLVAELPRSPIGKVLKRELRDSLIQGP